MTAARIRRHAVALLVSLAPAAAPAAQLVECVVAQVNGDVVTLSDVERQKKAVLDELYRQKLPDDELQKRIEEARARLLPGLIEEKLLLQKAKESGLAVAKDEVERIVRSIMDQNKIADEEGLGRALQAEGLTLAQLRANIERRTLMEKIKQFEVASKIVVTDEEIQRYYAEHKEDFRETEKVRLREIVLLIEKREEEQVRKEIEEIANLVRNGADFAELAALFSQAPTAEHGGDLGLVAAADLTADIAAAAATLKEGQVSAPIKTKFGFHILKLVERKPLSYRTAEEAKADIERTIQDTRFGDKLKAYTDELRAKAYVKISDACKEIAERAAK